MASNSIYNSISKTSVTRRRRQAGRPELSQWGFDFTEALFGPGTCTPWGWQRLHSSHRHTPSEIFQAVRWLHWPFPECIAKGSGAGPAFASCCLVDVLLWTCVVAGSLLPMFDHCWGTPQYSTRMTQIGEYPGLSHKFLVQGCKPQECPLKRVWHKSVFEESQVTVKEFVYVCAFVHPFRDHLKCQVDLDHFGSTSSPDSERHFEHVWACELEKIEGSKGSIEEIEEMSEPYGTVCGGTSTDRLHLHRLVSWLSDWPWFANYCFQS